jgi:hypothetical protein
MVNPVEKLVEAIPETARHPEVEHKPVERVLGQRPSQDACHGPNEQFMGSPVVDHDRAPKQVADDWHVEQGRNRWVHMSEGLEEVILEQTLAGIRLF